MSDRQPPSDDDLSGKRLLERILPEIIKRAVESGVERIVEGPETLRHLVGDLKLPKEAVSYLFVQVDETKNGLYRVVAKEIRDFLMHTNVADELTKALTKLSFEIKTEIRFIPNDATAEKADKLPKPDVRASVRVKDDRKAERSARRDERDEREGRDGRDGRDGNDG